MLRHKKYQITFNRLLKDERISPNRRMLLALLQIYTDAKASGDHEEADKFWDIIKVQYGSSYRVNWTDREDPMTEYEQTQVEMAAAREIKEMYASLGGDKDK